jgi:signal transduction histidine kinase
MSADEVRDIRWDGLADPTGGRTLRGVVEDFCAALLMKLDVGDGPSETVNVVLAAVAGLQAELDPFDHQLQRRRQPVEELLARIRTLERRLDEAVTKVVAVQQQTEISDRTLRVLLSHIGLDLHDPLETVLRLVELLSLEDLSVDQRMTVTEIVRAAIEVMELVSDTLDLCRLEGHSLPLFIGPVALPNVVDHACQMVRPMAEEHGVAVTAAGNDPSVHVRADRNRLEQVLTALILHSVTASRPGGEVTVGWTSTVHRVVVSIRDSGHGFPPETLAQFFAPSGAAFEAPSGRSRLRLVLAGHLVEAMQGRIDVASEPGRGSTFTVQLIRERQVPGSKE